MRKVRYFFADILAMEYWLNSMAKQGWKLVRAGTVLWEFVSCEPDSWQYQVAFTGADNWKDAQQYQDFLQELGYEVYTKNMNINCSVGKIRWRPWAKKGGKIAFRLGKHGGFNRELFIVAKPNDGMLFSLYSNQYDFVQHYQPLAKGCMFSAILLGLLTVVAGLSASWGITGFLSLCTIYVTVTAFRYQKLIWRYRKELQILE